MLHEYTRSTVNPSEVCQANLLSFAKLALVGVTNLSLSACRVFKTVLQECYYDEKHFFFELKKSEAQKMCRLFDRTAQPVMVLQQVTAAPAPVVDEVRTD